MRVCVLVCCPPPTDQSVRPSKRPAITKDDGRVVTFLGRFTWQREGEVALVKLIARPLSLSGE